MVVEQELLESSQGEDVEASTQRPDLRLELKVKNSRLWHAIYDRYGSVAGLCREVPKLRTKHNDVGKLLRFKESPWTKHGELRTLGYTLVKILEIPPEELFPPRLYQELWESERVLEVRSFSALPDAIQKEIRLLPAPEPENPIETLNREELKERLGQVFCMLTYREREILKLRFGIGERREYSLEEVGNIFKIGRERVRQIEATAIRKLQHPARSRHLKAFVT